MRKVKNDVLDQKKVMQRCVTDVGVRIGTLIECFMSFASGSQYARTPHAHVFYVLIQDVRKKGGLPMYKRHAMHRISTHMLSILQFTQRHSGRNRANLSISPLSKIGTPSVRRPGLVRPGNRSLFRVLGPDLHRLRDISFRLQSRYQHTLTSLWALSGACRRKGHPPP